MIEFPARSQVDFQVKAMIGYIHRVLNPDATSQLDLYPYVFTGEESGWSNTQALTINENLFTSTESGIFQIAIVVGILVVVVVAFLVYFKKRKH